MKYLKSVSPTQVQLAEMLNISISHYTKTINEQKENGTGGEIND